MAPKRKINLPPVELPQIELGAEDDRNLGQFVADAKLKIMQEAFSQKYEQGLSTWYGECAPSDVDVLLGDRIAALMLEGQRRGLIKAVVRSSIYATGLVIVCFLVRMPLKFTSFVVPVAFIGGVCMSRKN